MRLFRIARRIHTDPAEPFAGLGAYYGGSRWCTPGHYMSFASHTHSLATLEYLAHLEDRALARDIVLVRAELDAALIEALNQSLLPPDWARTPPGDDTKAIGDAWLRAMSAPAIRVPSAVIPDEANVLINPGHHQFSTITVIDVASTTIDARLLYHIA